MKKVWAYVFESDIRILFVMYDILFIDVNECETGYHNCTYYATCVNTEGTFICQFQEEVVKDKLRRSK